MVKRETTEKKRTSRHAWERLAALKDRVERLVRTDLNQASLLVDRMERMAAQTGDPLSGSFARASLAILLHFQGKHAQANRFYESSARELRAAGLKTQAALIEKRQVYALTDMGRYAEALSVARRARRVLANDNPVHLAGLETSIGTIYYRLDNYKRALEHYDSARRVLPRNASNSMRALIDGNRSNVFLETDQPEKALRLLEGAIQAWEQTGERLAAAQARSKTAYLHYLRGNYNTALSIYYPVRDQLEALGSGWLAAWCDMEIAEILSALNTFTEAVESAEKARARFVEMGMPYESAQASVVLALAALGLKQFDSARENLVGARAVFDQNQNTTVVALIDSYLAELALQRGDPSEASNRAEASLRVFARQKLAARSSNSQRIIAWARYLAGDITGALRQARSALRRSGRLSLPGVVYQCHHLIGKIERDRGDTAKALDSLRLAVSALERMRGGIVADEFKASFLRDKIAVYEDAIAACLDEGGKARIEEAFRLVESSKSSALAALLARFLRGVPTGKSEAGRKDLESETRARLLKSIEDLNWYSSKAGREEDKGGQRRARVAERYREKVLRCERQISQLFRRLEATGSAFVEIQSMRATDPNELCEILEPEETAIEYFTVGNEISAFVATREGLFLERGIASKGEVERLLKGLRFQLEKFNYGPGFADEHFEQLNHAANQHLIRLYELIFAAVEKRLQGRSVIVMPHGLLHYVPFHALLDRRGYLIDRFEVSYAPSATVLKLCRNRGAERRQGQERQAKSAASKRLQTAPSNGHRPSGGKIVALGAADRDTPNINDEVNALRSIFPDGVTFTGREATRANLMKFAPRARLLHLASHGYFRGDNPMFSFLKLADAPLNFYNLLDLKLEAELVTLSACHTGVNAIFPGDELHGLMRGFLYAGAPSLVASLWAANDRSTAAFMRAMYTRIRDGETKRAALRAAQLAVKDEYGHPYYWAPFVLMGNPN